MVYIILIFNTGGSQINCFCQLFFDLLQLAPHFIAIGSGFSGIVARLIVALLIHNKTVRTTKIANTLFPHFPAIIAVEPGAIEAEQLNSTYHKSAR